MMSSFCGFYVLWNQSGHNVRAT